ncbi:MAG: Asp23/Gls24 family envelope stress response protein [bacterium]
MERKIGEVKVSNEAIASIAGITASNVDGVVGLSGGIRDGIVNILTRGQVTKGVKVEVGQEEVIVDVSIILRYGVKIFDVSFSVQEAVKKAIQDMTGLRVVEVNVFVEGVEIVEKEERRLK